MEIQNWQEITLDSETFEQARQNFDMLLQKLFQKMEQNNSDEGSITLKVDINMIDDYVTDEEGNSKRVCKPVLKHKVSTAVPVKDSFDGKKDTGMELVYDEELKRYVLKYVSSGGQMSMFDPDYQEVINGEATFVDEERPALEANYLLEGEVIEQTEEPQDSDSDVEDGVFEEIQGGEEKTPQTAAIALRRMIIHTRIRRITIWQLER